MTMLLEKLTGIETRYEEVNQGLLTVGNDYHLAADLGKEKADLDPFIEAIQDYRESLEQLEGAQSLAESADNDLRDLAELDIDDLKSRIEDLEAH